MYIHYLINSINLQAFNVLILQMLKNGSLAGIRLVQNLKNALW